MAGGGAPARSLDRARDVRRTVRGLDRFAGVVAQLIRRPTTLSGLPRRGHARRLLSLKLVTTCISVQAGVAEGTPPVRAPPTFRAPFVEASRMAGAVPYRHAQSRGFLAMIDCPFRRDGGVRRLVAPRSSAWAAGFAARSSCGNHTRRRLPAPAPPLRESISRRAVALSSSCRTVRLGMVLASRFRVIPAMAPTNRSRAGLPALVRTGPVARSTVREPRRQAITAYRVIKDRSSSPQWR